MPSSEVKRVESRNLLKREESREVKCWWVLLRFLLCVEGMLKVSNLHCFALCCTFFVLESQIRKCCIFSGFSLISPKNLIFCFLFFVLFCGTIELLWCLNLSILEKKLIFYSGSLVFVW